MSKQQSIYIAGSIEAPNINSYAYVLRRLFLKLPLCVAGSESSESSEFYFFIHAQDCI